MAQGDSEAGLRLSVEHNRVNLIAGREARPHRVPAIFDPSRDKRIVERVGRPADAYFDPRGPEFTFVLFLISFQALPQGVDHDVVVSEQHDAGS
jgi:hypothetical protein